VITNYVKINKNLYELHHRDNNKRKGMVEKSTSYQLLVIENKAVKIKIKILKFEFDWYCICIAGRLIQTIEFIVGSAGPLRV
jgi:hypothetical protein